MAIDRHMNERDKYFLKAQFREIVGEIGDYESAVMELFDLLFEKGIIASNNFGQLKIALKNIQRPDLVEILEDEGETEPMLFTPYVGVNRVSNEDYLTDQCIISVCRELTPLDLTDLGVIGFGLGLAVVTCAKHDAKNTMDAALTIFQEWKKVAPINEFVRPHGNEVPIYGKSGLKSALKKAHINHLL